MAIAQVDAQLTMWRNSAHAYGVSSNWASWNLQSAWELDSPMSLDADDFVGNRNATNNMTQTFWDRLKTKSVGESTVADLVRSSRIALMCIPLPVSELLGTGPMPLITPVYYAERNGIELNTAAPSADMAPECEQEIARAATTTSPAGIRLSRR